MLLKVYAASQNLWSDARDATLAFERGMRARARDEGGATAIEYALLVALVALVIIVGLRALGTNVNDKFQNISDNANL